MSVSEIKVLMRRAVERIWLVPITEDGGLIFNWCDCPAPGEGMDPAESVEYVRADVHRHALRNTEAERDHAILQAQIHAQEARTQQATVAEIYRLCSGGNGEPGDSHGAEPVRKLIEERDELLGRVDFLSQQNNAQQEQNDELAGHIDRLHRAADAYETSVDSGGAPSGDEIYRLRAALADKPESSLAKIKAQWQAKALRSAAKELGTTDTAKWLMHRADTIEHIAKRRQAEGEPFTAAREGAQSVEDDV